MIDNSNTEIVETKDIPVKHERNKAVIEVNTEKGENARYLKHALATFDLPPLDVADAKAVEDRVKWYFQHCIENDMKPTVNGLANSLGVHRDTLHTWATGEARAATHTDIIKKAYSVLQDLWENYMLNGKVNPVAGIFVGKNHFKYKNNQDIVVTPSMGDKEEDPETVRKKYIENTPELLEATKKKEE